MDRPTFGAFAATLKSDITEWAKTRCELLRLEMLEKASAIGSLLLYGLILLNVVFFALLFAFLALGFLLAEWLQSLVGGFALITLLYLLMLGLLVVRRQSLLAGLKNLFLRILEPDLTDESVYESQHARRANSDTETDVRR
jgi:hypothetical protein